MQLPFNRIVGNVLTPAYDSGMDPVTPRSVCLMVHCDKWEVLESYPKYSCLPAQSFTVSRGLKVKGQA